MSAVRLNQRLGLRNLFYANHIILALPCMFE